jgi:dihydrofolate synthase/folylpolyglutamate synthase
LLFSVVGDKEYMDMIRRVENSGLFEEYIIAGIADDRGLSGEQIVNCFQNVRAEQIHLCESVREAYHTALNLKGDGVVYITGSLYLAGEVKALLKEESK